MLREHVRTYLHTYFMPRFATPDRNKGLCWPSCCIDPIAVPSLQTMGGNGETLLEQLREHLLRQVHQGPSVGGGALVHLSPPTFRVVCGMLAAIHVRLTEW